MKLVVFGLSVSSSWGNGHATVWRGLIRALGRAGHRVVFFERDAPYYAPHRDLDSLEGDAGLDLVLYADFNQARSRARAELADADAAIVTSYCPDAAPATELVLDAPAPRRLFYDLDAPVTFARLDRGEPVEYLPPGGLGQFDLVLSFTGGPALTLLRERLGARRVAPLYGSVDAAVHRPAPPTDRFRADLAHLGTWSADRQPALDELLLAPARLRPTARFVVAGPLYPRELAWPPNVARFEHLAPGEHAAFYSSARLQLNVTRAAMARLGWCPSGRLFEAAACAAPILTDHWPGLEQFFTPGEEVLVARTAYDAVAALDLPRSVLQRVGRAAQERALAEHTAEQRARELEVLIESVADRGGAHDGDHSGGGDRQSDPAAGVLEGAAAGR